MAAKGRPGPAPDRLRPAERSRGTRSASRGAEAARSPRDLVPHLVCLTVLIAAVMLRLLHFTVPSRTPDESAYHTYAQLLYDRGPSVLPEIVREYRSKPEWRDFPSPTRVGHLWLHWAAMLVSFSPSTNAVASVSFAASVGLLLIVWRIAASFLAPWAAPVAMTFLAFSPLDLAITRRLWGDEPFAFAVAVMLWCFLEYARSRRTFWAAAFFLSSIPALLIKETALFFLVLGTLGLMWRRPVRQILVLAAAGVSTVATALAIQALACGGWQPVREAWAGAMGAGKPSEYMLKYQTGGWAYYARGLGILQPFEMALGFAACLAAVVAAIVALVRRKGSGLGEGWRWPKTLVVLGVMVVSFLTLALAYPQKNMRFLSPIYAPLFLMGGAAVYGLVERFGARVPSTVRPLLIGAVIAALLWLAANNHQRFVFWFIERAVPDLATPWFVSPTE